MIKNAHIICYSGGEASALAAIEVSRKHGTGSLILLNHDIIETSEDADVKRFKNEIAGFIGVPVTYANMPGWERKDQFDVVVEAGAFVKKEPESRDTNHRKEICMLTSALRRVRTREFLTINILADERESK